MAFINPQTPLKNLKTGDYFYPLTNLNQIICTSNRLSVFMNESSNNNLTLNNIDRINGKVQITGSDSSSFLGALAEEQFNKTDIRTWCDTVTNIHKSSYQGDMVLKRFYSQDEPAADYNLPCVDSHMMIFSLNNTSIDYTRILALDMHSPILFIGGKRNGDWQTWTQLITDNTAQTISGQKTFTSLLKINTNGNTITIGSANTEWCHFQNSANIPFYFNKQIQANSSFKIYNNNTILGAGYLELSGGTPYIDFCFNNSTADYTSRIIENASGRLYIPGKLAIAYTNDSYSLAAASFICNSWVRTIGDTGWYSQTYGGGWYMADTTWIRNYGSKAVYLNNQLRIDSNLNVGANSTGGNIICGTYKDTAHGEHQIQVNSGAGRWYLYSQPSATGVRGLYAHNNAGTGLAALYMNQDNYLRSGTRIYGAVWNDYAEFRKGQMDNLKPGQVVTEIGNGEMKLANKKLQKGCKILSDTYGFALGETKECKLPIAVAGRVLVYCDTAKEELEPGDCLCANYTGNTIKMTQEEIIKYPDRIVGIVSEIPNYNIWYSLDPDNPDVLKEEIQVNGRIWVYVR